MVEAVPGIVLILGTKVRLAVMALPVLMVISFIVLIIQGNSEAALVEFIGHVPIIGVALILLLLGYDQRLRFTDAFSAPRHSFSKIRSAVPDAIDIGQSPELM